MIDKSYATAQETKIFAERLPSKASRPSFILHTTLPPPDVSTEISEPLAMPKLSKCFFVLSSAAMRIILSCVFVGANTNGITCLLYLFFLKQLCCCEKSFAKPKKTVANASNVLRNVLVALKTARLTKSFDKRFSCEYKRR